MNTNIIKSTAMSISRWAVKYAPQLWTGAGIGLIVGGTVFAVKAGMRTPDILYEHRTAMEDLEGEHQSLMESEKLSKEDELAVVKEYRRNAFLIYRDTALMFAREYWPTIILMGGGIACIVGGHRILAHRNRILTAALTTTTDAYNRYRKAVREKYGEQVDTMIANGLEEETKTIETVDEEGKKHKEKVKELVAPDGTKLSPYARFFDESSREWTKEPFYNQTFLKCQQEAANKLLYSRYILSGDRKFGYVFLNEVYDMLGLEPSKEGCLVGWTFKEDMDGKADGYISFGIHNVKNPQKMAFEAGMERSILLDFNVDGVIYDQL